MYIYIYIYVYIYNIYIYIYIYIEVGKKGGKTNYHSLEGRRVLTQSSHDRRENDARELAVTNSCPCITVYATGIVCSRHCMQPALYATGSRVESIQGE